MYFSKEIKLLRDTGLNVFMTLYRGSNETERNALDAKSSENERIFVDESGACRETAANILENLFTI